MDDVIAREKIETLSDLKRMVDETGATMEEG